MTASNEDIDWRLEHASSAYAAEVEAMHRLRDRTSYVVGLFVTPAGGAIYFLYGSFSGNPLAWPSTVFFLLPIALATILVTVGLLQLFVMLNKGHIYSAPPLPSKLTAFYLAFPERDKALLKTKEKLLTAYESAVDHNTVLNGQRTAVLVTAQRLVAWSFPWIVLAGIYSYSQAVNHVEPPIRVEIVKP